MGGAGILLVNGGSVLNTGAIQGGAGAEGGPGGSGVLSTGDASVTTAGNIGGGLRGDGTTRANAVDLTGGGNTLTLLPGYSFSGNVVSTSGASNGGDTLALGGDAGSNAFDASSIVTSLPASYSGTQYVGFARFVKTGAGLWTLTGNGSGQDWTIANGTLAGDTNSLTGNIRFAPAPGDSAAVSFNQSSAGVYAGRIDGAGSFSKSGNGTLTITDALTYTGATSIATGTLALSGQGSIAASSGLTNNGTFDISGTSSGATIKSLAGNGQVNLGGSVLTLSGANANDVFSGMISDGGNGGSLVIAGGTQTLQGLNRYSGATTIRGGATLSLVGASGLTSSSVTNDGVLDVSGTTNGGNIKSLTGAGRVELGAAALRLTIANGTFSGVINGAGGLSVAGGAETLTGVNTYTGVTNLNAGATLALGGTGSIAASSRLISDGTFDISDTVNGATITSLAGGGSGRLGSQTLSLSNAGDTFSGVIDGTGGVTLVGGTETLNGANTYTGLTTVHSGATLALGSAGSIARTSGLVNDGAFDISSTANGATLNSLSGHGSVSLGSRTLTLAGADGTFQGVIAGSGGLAVTGGREVLAGANTYSGGTTIAQGTLQLGNGGTTGSIVGDVTNSGTLAFNRSNAVTFGGSISGSGAVQQLGTGTTTLTGISTYSGATTVDAGTLQVDGTLASAVTVNAGATLRGSGSIGALTLNAGATLAPGSGSTADEAKSANIAQRRAGIAPASIGALTINGSLVLGAGSVYAVQANAAGQSSRTVVGGTATLQGGTVQVLADSGGWGPRTQYTILSASALDGSFSGVSSNLAFLDPSLSYDASHVFLTLARNDVDFAAVATSGNQRAVGAALQQASQGTLSDAGAQLIGAVQNLSAEQARGAFDALSGSALAGTQNLALLSSQAFVASLQQPMQSAREPARGDASATTPHWWAALLESGARLPGDEGIGSAPERDRLWGVALGVDQALNARARVGAALGISQGAFSVSAQQTRGTVRGWHAGVYGQWQFEQAEPWYLNGQLAYSGLDNHVSRSIDSFGGLTQQLPLQADYTSRAWRARLELGRTMGWRTEGHLTPYAALELAEVRNQGYAESGSMLGLNVAGHGTRSTPGYLGLRLDDRHELAGGMVLTPSVDAAWVHEFSRKRSVTAVFSALPDASFTTEGARPARDALALKLGAQLALSRTAALYARLGGELAGHASSYSAQAGVQLRW